MDEENWRKAPLCAESRKEWEHTHRLAIQNQKNRIEEVKVDLEILKSKHLQQIIDKKREIVTEETKLKQMINKTYEDYVEMVKQHAKEEGVEFKQLEDE